LYLSECLIIFLSPTYSPIIRPTPPPTLFPYTTLFRSAGGRVALREGGARGDAAGPDGGGVRQGPAAGERRPGGPRRPLRRQVLRSEEHTSELQSHLKLVCRLLLAKTQALKLRSLNFSI